LLRERRQSHIDASLCRPVLIVDEDQEMLVPVLAEAHEIVVHGRPLIYREDELARHSWDGSRDPGVESQS
jgi:hypothetical protein